MRWIAALLCMLGVCLALGCGGKKSEAPRDRGAATVGVTLLGTEEERALLSEFVLSLTAEQLQTANKQGAWQEWVEACKQRGWVNCPEIPGLKGSELTARQRVLLDRLWALLLERWQADHPERSLESLKLGPMEQGTVWDVGYYFFSPDPTPSLPRSASG